MALVLNGSGITSANIVNGTIVDEDVADVAASKRTGALPAIDGSALTGMPAGGKVLQVVQASVATTVISTTNTFVDTGLTATITPTSTSSKILVFVEQSCTATSPGYMGFNLLRGGTSIRATTYTMHSGSGTVILQLPYNYLDSPNTTSATVYKTQFKATNAVDVRVQSNSASSTITLMEIGV